MEPSETERRGASTGDAGACVQAYLNEVRSAQVRLIETLASAPNSLPSDSTNLLAMCAASARLTRMFLDMQLGMLDRELMVERRLRTLVDDEVGRDPAPEIVDRRTVREVIADLGRELVSSPDDLVDVAAVLAAAFEPDEPDIAEVTTGIRSTLDAWWSRREAELEVLLADGRARVALEQHLERLAARTDVASPVVAESADDRVGIDFSDLLSQIEQSIPFAAQRHSIARPLDVPVGGPSPSRARGTATNEWRAS